MEKPLGSPSLAEAILLVKQDSSASCIYCTCVVNENELLDMFRSWVCARTLKLLTSFVPAAAVTFTRIVTAIVSCAGNPVQLQVMVPPFCVGEGVVQEDGPVPPVRLS